MKFFLLVLALIGAVQCDPTVYFKEEFEGKHTFIHSLFRPKFKFERSRWV